MTMHEFEANPGTRIATLYGEVEFDKHGKFITTDPAVAQDIARHLAANPALTEGAGETEEPYEGWVVADLKLELEKRDLSKSGNRAALVDRLVADDEGAGAAETEPEGGAEGEPAETTAASEPEA